MFGALCSARRAALRSALPPRAPLAGPARGLATRSGALLSPQRTGVSDRTRRKLPLAKAKAKAQASRALLASLESGGQQTRPGDKPLREAIAWATADAYDLKALAASGRLPADWQMLEDDDAIYVPVWPAGVHADAPVGPPGFLGPQGHEAGGEVFVFASGTYVTWGLDEGRSRRFLEDIIRPAGDVEQRRYIHVGDEALEFVWHEEEPTRIVGDVIVLGSAPVEEAEGARWESWTPLQARLAYSQGLSRSARLSAEEDVLDDFLASLANIPEQLEAGGKVPLPRKDVIRKQGTLLRLRQRTNLAKDNFFDSPEGHWDNGSLERKCRFLHLAECVADGCH